MALSRQLNMTGEKYVYMTAFILNSLISNLQVVPLRCLAIPISSLISQSGYNRVGFFVSFFLYGLFSLVAFHYVCVLFSVLKMTYFPQLSGGVWLSAQI